MAVDSELSTFEQSQPRRPGQSDILNGTKTNAGAPSPVPPNCPAAEEFHQIALLLEAFGAMIPCTRVSVTGGASPTVFGLMSIRDDVVAGDVTIARASAGVVVVTMPASKYPAATCRPMAALNGTDGGYTIEAEYVANGARVRTKNAAGTATDASFTLELFGS